jgi:hypothetical protein
LRRGGGQHRWHSLVNCDHGDSTTHLRSCITVCVRSIGVSTYRRRRMRQAWTVSLTPASGQAFSGLL